jgi:sulfhydrogenase subunit beta (sulfur reductase)
MSAFFIADPVFASFVDALRQATRVVGPVAKRQKFIFAELDSASDLRLDYDVTILPPKKIFFPPRQEIIKFGADSVEGRIAPVETVLLGVHFYDVKGLDMTDFLLRERFEDWNYLAQREATTVVASNIQTIAPRAFWGSVGTEVVAQGHDALLTKLQGGYVFEALTPKGDALLAYGDFREATADEVASAAKVNADIMDKCPEILRYSSTDIATKVRESFGNEELWDELAMDCFSCGSCNTVCPTCYCFDVRDSWNIDQTTGQRTRYWDACLTREFAAVTMAGGLQENFREHHQSRFRHRFMRKAAYLNDKLGGPACVGCGRCSAACTANIADPVRVINAIMEATHDGR